MAFLTELKNNGIKIFTRKLQKTSNEEILKNKQEILEDLDLCKICYPLVRNRCKNSSRYD